jgi:hypothetical protein
MRVEKGKKGLRALVSGRLRVVRFWCCKGGKVHYVDWCDGRMHTPTGPCDFLMRITDEESYESKPVDVS